MSARARFVPALLAATLALTGTAQAQRVIGDPKGGMAPGSSFTINLGTMVE